MTAARPTDDVETLACAAAAGYAGRWARSMARTAARDGAGAPAAWIVDGFAGADLQRAALRGATVQPPVLATLRAADEALEGRVRMVLVEEDPGLLARLEEALRGAGAGGRLRRTGDPATAEPGEIVLVEAAFASLAAGLARQIGGEPALVRLAPLAARALPLDALEAFAVLAGTDLLVRVPQEDFLKQARFGGPLADFPPHLRRVVDGCSALLGDPRHGWLLAWREAERAAGPDAALAATVERLRDQLAVVYGDVDRLAQAVRLEGKGGAVHLLLATPHPEHALELEGAVTDGGATPLPKAPGSTGTAAASTGTGEPTAKRSGSRKAAKQAALPAPTTPPEPLSDAAPSIEDAAPASPPVSGDADASPAPVEAGAGPALLEGDDDAAPPVAEGSADAVTGETADASDSAPEADRAPDAASPDASHGAEPAPVPTEAPRAASADESAPVAAPSRTWPVPLAPEPKPEEAPALDLFALPAAPAPEVAPRGPDLRAAADELHARHVGQQVPVRELLAGMADTGLSPEQVRAVLALLKRAGRAAFRSLDAEDAEVDFLLPPSAAPAAPPAARKKKPRPSDPALLGLFDDPEPAAPGDDPPMTLDDVEADVPATAPPIDLDAPMTMDDIEMDVVMDPAPAPQARGAVPAPSAASVPDEPPPPPAKKPRRRKG